MTNPLAKLFSRRDKSAPTGGANDVPTQPIPNTMPIPFPPAEQETEATPQVVNTMRQFSAACAQSVGRVREHNEDSLYMLTTQTTNNGDNTPLGLYIVADGMGGHQHGELASGLAVRSIANSILRKIFIPLTSVKPTPPAAPLQEILEDSVIEAHKAITREAPGSGTTLTVVLLVDRTMLTAHVGDSRAYWIPDNGDVQVLTRDHSFVMRMLELGQITEAEAAVHPQRNVLYKALGQGEPSAPDISSSALPENGLLLLCSDGLWGVAPQNDMLEILRNTPDLQAAAQKLVDRANELGGPDNITAVLVRLPPNG